MDISVIIPAYNREATISRAIESVRKQTYPVSEIIVVDDASSDNTEQVVKSIDDNRIVYFRQEKNMGACAARNKGVSLAKCGIVAFQDSDDEWRPDKVEKQIAYYNDNRQYRMVYTAYVKHFTSSDLIIPDENDGFKHEGDILKELLFQNYISTQTIMMEKSLFERIGGFDESLKSLQDWDLAIRASKECPIGYVNEVLAEVFVSANAITGNREEYYRSRCYLMRKYRNDYLSTGTFNDTAESILALAYEDGMLDRVKNMLLHYIST